MIPSAVHLAVYDTLADWEYGYAVAHISGHTQFQREPARYEIRTVAATPDPIRTVGGVRILPDLVLADLDPADSAMLILPGADTWLTEAMAPFLQAARRFVGAGVPVAGICGATAGLAAEGLLDDRLHTSSAPEVLQATGYAGAAHYQDRPAVSDRGVITAGGVAPVDFAREIIAALDLYEPQVLDAWYRLYGDQDPAGYFDLMAATSDEPVDA